MKNNETYLSTEAARDLFEGATEELCDNTGVLDIYTVDEWLRMFKRAAHRVATNRGEHDEQATGDSDE